MRKYLNFLLLALLLVLPSLSWSNFGESTAVQVELIQEQETIQPGEPFWVAVHFKMEEGWHLYWKNPGDVGVPLNINWQLPSGFQVSALEWPFPEKFSTAGMIGFGYAKEVVLLAQLSPPQDLQVDASYELGVQAEWLVCSSMMCQPGSISKELAVRVDNHPPQLQEKNVLLFQEARKHLPISTAHVGVKRNRGGLQLEIPTVDRKVTTAYFFPEEQDLIDYTAEAEPNQETHAPHTYLLSLKEKSPVKTLKGVLVLTTENPQGRQEEAFEINQEVQDDGTGLISLADESLIGPVSKENPTENAHEFEGGLGLALLLAFAGGMILNLMPCVLPIISLKVMSFVKMAGKKRSLTIKHGLWFSLGVLISFWILVGAIFILRAYGQVVGWGFQLQEPIFVVILASLFFIFALSLFGIFEWGLIFASWAGQTQSESVQSSQDSFAGSFFSGILATAVATPCTGPFLGSALGFALTLPALEALLVFTFLGLGMCFPYLLLAAFPALLRFIPKPGAWMETFKQMTGFILLAAVVWLMWVFSAQTNSFSLICLIAGFLSFAIGAWIYGRGGVPSAGKTKRICSYIAVVVCLFVGFQVIVLPRATWNTSNAVDSQNEWGDWENFSVERVAELRAQGKPVLIDFTAKWCLICQLNHFVLASKEVQQKMNQLGVVKMKADWTKNDPMITKELSKFGRNSVPLYVIYGSEKEQEPLILPQVLTPDIIASNLDQAITQKNIAMGS